MISNDSEIIYLFHKSTNKSDVKTHKIVLNVIIEKYLFLTKSKPSTAPLDNLACFFLLKIFGEQK